MGILGSIFKIGASIIGGNSSKKASKKAQAAQIAALQSGINTLNTQFGDAKQLSSPWTEGGADAQQALLTLLGLGDGGAQGQSAAITGLKEDPVYQALFGNAVNTTLANASATGGVRGGNVQDALGRVGVDTLGKVYQDRVGSLAGVSGLGLQAVMGLEGLGAENAAAIAALFGKQGDAKAGGILQRGAINNQMVNTISSEVGKIADSIPGLPF